MWRELGINSWPTFAVVSPNGKVIAQIAGEGHRKVTFWTPCYAFSLASQESHVIARFYFGKHQCSVSRKRPLCENK